MKMVICDVFYLSDGTTVFKGIISDFVPLIMPCMSNIFLNGDLVAQIKIEGEFLISPNRTSHRAVSTKDEIKIDNESLENEKYVIEFILDE